MMNSDEFIKWYMSSEQKDRRYKIRCKLNYCYDLLKVNDALALEQFNQVTDETEKDIISQKCCYKSENQACEALKITIRYLEATLK